MTISESPMTTSALIDEILDTVHGYVRTQEAKTHLTTATVNPGDLTFLVADPTAISSGLVEVDEELMYVKSVDKSSGLVTIEPWGRAQSQTSADVHVSGAKVVNNPLFPRQRVRNVLWGVLREIFPDLYAVGEVFEDVNPAKTNYVMPTDCWNVLSVQWHLPGPTGMWAEANRWKQNKRAGDPIEIELLSRVWPGSQRVRVQYMKNPPATFALNDDLGAYGYDFQIHDLLILGSVARLMAYAESARLNVETVVSHGRSEMVPAGSSASLSKYLYQLFKQRVMDERAQQLIRHPIQIHFTR